MKNKLIYILDGMRVKDFQQICMFSLTISLTKTSYSYNPFKHNLLLLVSKKTCWNYPLATRIVTDAAD